MCKAGLTHTRKIWLTRHGESEYNTRALLGGNSGLSPKGQAYARQLPDIIVDRIPLVQPPTQSADKPHGQLVPCTVPRSPCSLAASSVPCRVAPLLHRHDHLHAGPSTHGNIVAEHVASLWLVSSWPHHHLTLVV